MKESDIQKKILNYLRKAGWYVLRINSGMQLKNYVTKGGSRKRYAIRMAPKGTPDVIACAPDGCFVAIEVKKPGGVVSVAQEEKIGQINNIGGLALVSDSLDDLKKQLTTYGY